MDVKNPKTKGPSYLGKLRATNTKKNEYLLFDSGENPEKAKQNQALRKTFMLLQFNDETIPEIGNVKTTKCFIPKWENEKNDYEGFDDPYELGFSKKALTIINKPPKWNSKKKQYVYNFGGRVQEASNKNTQLIVDEYLSKLTKDSDATSATDKDLLIKEHIIFQFGKFDKNSFSLDLQ